MNEVYEKLFAEGIRVTLDDRSDKIGYKIREARQVMRVPHMLIIGAKEVENGTVSVRNRDTDETTVMTVDALIAMLKEEKNRLLVTACDPTQKLEEFSYAFREKTVRIACDSARGRGYREVF